MSNPHPVYKGGGPFSRIVAARFSRNIRFDFSFTRDDGIVFTPDLDENLTIAIYSPTWTLLCSCESKTLDYNEEVEGLVTGFSYALGYYRLELDMKQIKDLTGLSRRDFECLLITRGSKTLETAYDRAYLSDAPATLIKPGLNHITIPYWHLDVEYDYPTLYKTNKQTTLYSSIPFKTSLELLEAQALAWFQMERLGVTWNPLPDLSGWHGTFDIRDVCVGGTILAPYQIHDWLTQPSEKPSSHQDQRYVIYEQVLVKLSLSACPGGWNQMDLSINTNVGFSHYFPYVPPPEEAIPVDISHPLGSRLRCSPFGR
jgi:hypothetical protein